MAPVVAFQSPAVASRRAHLRYPASAFPSIAGVRLSPGEEVTLLNLSSSGMAVECARTFAAGSKVTVIFEGSFSPAQIRARVVRCTVSRIQGGALQFASALAFEGRLGLSAEPADKPAAVKDSAAEDSEDGSVQNRW